MYSSWMASFSSPSPTHKHWLCFTQEVPKQTQFYKADVSRSTLLPGRHFNYPLLKGTNVTSYVCKLLSEIVWSLIKQKQ